MAITFIRLAVFVIVHNVIKEIQMIKKFITSRLEERTTWDGAMIIGLGLIVLIAGPICKSPWLILLLLMEHGQFIRVNNG